MNQPLRPRAPARAAALNEELALWFGRLSSAPAPEHLVAMVDQMERVRFRAAAEVGLPKL